MKQNITLSMDKALIHKAKIIAAQRHTSISGMLSRELEKMVSEHERYERSKRNAIEHLEKGYHFGGKGIQNREALHEREDLRRYKHLNLRPRY